MRRKREGGATLLVVLLMLAGILLLGASGAQMALQDEMAARAERDRLVAFQAAEDALMDAEKDIGGAPGVPPERGAHFSGDGSAFTADCGGMASAAGLCCGVEGEAPVWQRVDLAAAGVAFGRFTGAAMETGRGTLPFARPRYVIERQPYSLPGEDAATPLHHYYRVTAIGFGPRPSAEVVLQVTLADKAVPAGRLSWREISNWRELHEAAKRK